jgi:malonyl CoA-acyl carrier protein transacylase
LTYPELLSEPVNIIKAIKNAVLREEKETESSHSQDRIASEELTEKFKANPEFPYLVSFSRTGSHWLRMLMELYFDKPSLRLLFYKTVKETKDYSCYHTHDLDLNVQAKNVIYLYRDPVDTIYSQMSFHGQAIDNDEMLQGWIELYARHLDKWLMSEKFTTKKTIITYEGLRSNFLDEFRKVSEFFNVKFDAAKAEQVSKMVSKEKIKEKTAHDPRVINLSSNYGDVREEFRKRNAKKIYDQTFAAFPGLQQFLKV